MEHLTPEAYRILKKRIVKVIERARYYPAEVADLEAAAEHVLRAFRVTPTPHRRAACE